jgi:hypothetical protein
MSPFQALRGRLGNTLLKGVVHATVHNGNPVLAFSNSMVCWLITLVVFAQLFTELHSLNV